MFKALNIITNHEHSSLQSAYRIQGLECNQKYAGRRKPGGHLQLGTDPRGDAFVWISSEKEQGVSPPGSDEEWIDKGWITITPLSVDMTDRQTMASFEKRWP